MHDGKQWSIIAVLLISVLVLTTALVVALNWSS